MEPLDQPICYAAEDVVQLHDAARERVHRHPEEQVCCERRQVDLDAGGLAVVLRDGGALVQAGHERRVPGGTGLDEPQLRAEAQDQRDIGGGELAPTDRVGRPLAVPTVAAYVGANARVRRP